MPTRYFVQVTGTDGALQKLPLALDDKGKPQFSTSVMAPIRPMFQAGEPGYAHFAPTIQGVYAQGDLSDGMGKKLQVPGDHPHGKRYYWAEGMDASVAGQLQRGPLVNVLTAPPQAGIFADTLSGGYVLGGNQHLLCGRLVYKWNGTANDTLTVEGDLGSSVVAQYPVTFGQLAVEAVSTASATVNATQIEVISSDYWVAQSFKIAIDNLARYVSRVDVDLFRTGTIAGDVRLRLCLNLNGRPGTTISTSRMLAQGLLTTGVVKTFRFDDDDQVLIQGGVPYWIVLDAVGATTAGGPSVSWVRDTVSGYANGTASTSTDGGNSWTDAAYDMYFTVYTRTATQTALIGDRSASASNTGFISTTDSSTFSRSSPPLGGFALIQGYVAAFPDSATTTSTIGYVLLSQDGGRNWLEPIQVGDPNVAVNRLLTVGPVLFVVKEDSIWAVDVTVQPFEVQAVYWGAPDDTTTATTNGQGACEWKGVAYIPFDGSLVAIEGDFSRGFAAHPSVGLESLQEWDYPWGPGRHMCVGGSRFHLWSIVSTSSSSRLVKARNPLRKNDDGTPNPDWHGALALIGTGVQTNRDLVIYEPGGSGSPELFCTTTGNDLARIRLPRTINPANDSNYRYNNIGYGVLVYPWATGNFFVNPKSWLQEPVAFHTTRANDYVQMAYNTQAGLGDQLCNDDDSGGGGRLYKTGVLKYPMGTNSVALSRALQMINSLTTASPLILASAVTYAMRPLATSPVQELTFVVDAEESLSAGDLGDMLGIGADTIKAALVGAAVGPNARTVIGPSGETYYNVLFLDAKRVFLGQTQGGPHSAIEVTAVSVP